MSWKRYDELVIAAEPSQRRRIPSWLPQVLGYTVSAACLIWVLNGYDFQQLANDFRTLDLKWVALAVVADLAVYVCHGWRWQTLLAPVSRLSFWRTVQSICQVSSPEANNNGWLWPGPLRAGLPFCWQTNRRATLIRAMAKR